MSVKSVGQNSAEEFFETFLMLTAYDEMKKIMHDYTKDIENPILQEAVESAMSVGMFGVLFMIIQKQEQIIAKVFDIAEAMILALLTRSRNLLSKLKGLKGTKAFRKLSFLRGSSQDDIATANVVANYFSGQSVAKATQMRSQGAVPMNTYQMQLDTKNTLYNREKMHMDMGNNMVTQYQSTLLFKLLSKSFTPNDTMMIKKILGRDTASALNIDDLNQVADFMFVKDTNGKVIGLTEVFLNMFNASSYSHK